MRDGQPEAQPTYLYQGGVQCSWLPEVAETCSPSPSGALRSARAGGGGGGWCHPCKSWLPSPTSKRKSIQTLVFFDQENKSCLPQQPGAGGKELDYQRPGLGPSGSFLSLTASACVETSREGKFSALHLLPALGPEPVSGCCMAHCAQQGLPGLH